MRNYWLRIVLGAVAIFAVGMIGVSLARQGVGHVRSVVEGSGPLTLPVAFIPFNLDGQKLGTVSKIVVQRDAPKRIRSVVLRISLQDSVIAQGLAGCRLLANFDQDRKGDVKVHVGPRSPSVFSCVHSGDSLNGFQEFGQAVFEPGDVTVPLYLPDDIVNDLQQGNFGNGDQDSIADAAQAQAESAADAAEAKADSIAEEAQKRANRNVARQLRFADSLRREGLRRQDSSLRFAPSPPTPPRPADTAARHR